MSQASALPKDKYKVLKVEVRASYGLVGSEILYDDKKKGEIVYSAEILDESKFADLEVTEVKRLEVL